MPDDQVRHILLLQKFHVQFEDQESAQLHISIGRLDLKNRTYQRRRFSLKRPRIIERLAVPDLPGVQLPSLFPEILLQAAQLPRPG